MKSNLFWFVEGQTHLSTSWHAKMSLTRNHLIEIVVCSNLHINLQACTAKFTEHGRCYLQNNQLLTRSHAELEVYSILLLLWAQKYLWDQRSPSCLLMLVLYALSFWMLWCLQVDDWNMPDWLNICFDSIVISAWADMWLVLFGSVGL